MDTFNWLDKKEYPFENKYVVIDNYNMHYIDEGEGAVIVFVHGTPSWSFEYRNIIKQLSKKYRCIAMDHIGFGLSDKPKNYAYTAQQHAQNLEAFINAIGIKEFTLAVHDFGGPIGLNYAVTHPGNIKKLIIANTWCFSVKQEPEFKKMKSILGNPLLPFLYLRLNFSAKYILPAAYGERSRLTKAIHTQFIKPFSHADERRGTLGFAKSLLKEQEWFESIWTKIKAIHAIPSLFIWGKKDQFVTEKYLNKFLNEFTKTEVIQYTDAGHFVLDEKSSVVLPVIESFLAK